MINVICPYCGAVPFDSGYLDGLLKMNPTGEARTLVSCSSCGKTSMVRKRATIKVDLIPEDGGKEVRQKVHKIGFKA